MNKDHNVQEISSRYLINLLLSGWRWIIAAVLLGGVLGAIPLLTGAGNAEEPIYFSYAQIYLDPKFSPYSGANVGIFKSDEILDKLRRQMPNEFDLAIEFQPGINQKEEPGILGLMVTSNDPAVTQPLASAWAEIVLNWLREGTLANERTENSLWISHEADSALFSFLDENGLGAITYCDVTYIVGVDPCPAYTPSEKILGLELSPEVKTELSGLVLQKRSARENSLTTIANNYSVAAVIDQHMFQYSEAEEAAPLTMPNLAPNISVVFPFIGVIAGFILAAAAILLHDWWIKGE